MQHVVSGGGHSKTEVSYVTHHVHVIKILNLENGLAAPHSNWETFYSSFVK